MTCFLHISATTSCVASTPHVEIAPVSSSSCQNNWQSPSSSSPGKLSVLSKQTSYHIFFSDICVEHRKKICNEHRQMSG